MLSQEIINDCANQLHQAEKTREQVRQLSLQHPDITIEDAYAIQRKWVEMKLAEGRSVIGHKIGLTSRAMQQSSQIDEPDYGTLLNDMLFQDGGDIPTDQFIVPRIEVELAFILAKPLKGPNWTIFDVSTATDYVVPALELIDARSQSIDPDSGRPRKVFDTISDNAANAGVVLGAERHAVDDFDLRWVGAITSRNGEVEETGLGAGVLNDPVESVVWLARRMAQYGQSIEPGQIILSGSFIRPVECPHGTEIRADFGPFGSVDIAFE